MKILNQQDRETSETGQTFQKTSISELKQTTEIDPRSLLHIAQFVRKNASGQSLYESMRITVDAFQNKLYESVQNTLKTEYWDTHCGPHDTEHTVNGENKGASPYPDGISFREMIDYLGEYDKDTNNKIWKPDVVPI